MALEDFITFEEDVQSAGEEVAWAGHGGGESRPTAPKEYILDGVTVRFPFEAYPCQVQMMQSIIRILNGQSRNGLLESPTGSGKSMALLCAVLAWFEQHKQQRRSKIKALQKEQEEKGEQCLPQKTLAQQKGKENDGEEKEKVLTDSWEEFSSQPLSKKCKGISCSTDPGSSCAKQIETPQSQPQPQPESSQSALPKIYITSRTHKQIAQLVSELARTSYAPKFVVLASRNHCCIKEEVRREKDVNEACRHLLSGGKKEGCGFFGRVGKFISKTPAYTPDMDIEDLIRMGKKERICPYFLARGSLEHAEVVFAPYNYLVDPLVRQAMGIELSHDIVIVDEAHNIEDVSREAASFEITEEELNSLAGELYGIISKLKNKSHMQPMHTAHEIQSHVVAVLSNWLKHANSGRAQVRRDFETSLAVWNGEEILEELASIGIANESIALWSRELQKILDRSEKSPPSFSKTEQQEEDQILSFRSCQILKGLYYSLANVMREDQSYLAGYRMVKYQSAKMEAGIKRLYSTLGFWCLHPEVIFRPLASLTKCVILTSGTLSPMDTFCSELGAKFDQRLEAPHVIDESQTWVGCIPTGPEGASFLGNYKTMDSFLYQDDLARALLKIVHIVPHGVLCFLPSYGFVEKLLKRMQNIGIYEQIAEIFVEPRQGSAKEFEKLMKNYYRVIADGQTTSRGPNGALFFAVYRGKVSEGLDLRDNNCRAVVAVGIPYPALKDPKVVLKREFNDRFALTKKVLAGQQWYEIQAFRALNQALGRCIRHCRDWGAVILLEQRFAQTRNVNLLSKWVRSRVRQFKSFDAAIPSLQAFLHDNNGKEENSIPEMENTIIIDN